MGTRTFALQGLDAERDVLRESQRLASERDRELETLRQQVRYFIIHFLTPLVDDVTCIQKQIGMFFTCIP